MFVFGCNIGKSLNNDYNQDNSQQVESCFYIQFLLGIEKESFNSLFANR